ncbi:deuterosome assembly protein 1 [Mixophyes fleayi]|uniref:deuterosome assembly protein 1 n=1 Tax=Mixophyes fleayi TaxID=3061075 RepID=UPI003F4E42F7
MMNSNNSVISGTSTIPGGDLHRGPPAPETNGPIGEHLAGQHSGFYTYQTMGDLSCENDLEELMHQIDIMVNSKKVEWEKRVHVLEQRLEARDRELTEARSVLAQKDCEIGILSKKLEQADEAQCEIVQNNERQLESLKSQLCNLKKNYEKLHYYHVKNQKHNCMEASADHEKSQCELRWLFQKLEEYKVQAKRQEKQWMLCQNNLKTLNEQRKTLAEKCDFFQKQSLSYQEQLSSRTQMQDPAITNIQSERRRLRCQLDASQETIGADGLIIEKLKSTVKEITLSRDSLKDEKQKLLQGLRNCQQRCQRLESELSEATIELQARDDLLRAVELDQRQIHKDMMQYPNSQATKLSFPESDLHTKNRTSNKEKVQKRLQLSPCKDQVEKDPSKVADLERLRADISDLTAKLNRKDVTIATISQKVSRLEQELEVREHETVHRQVLKSAEESIHADLCSASLEPQQDRPEKYCTSAQEIEREKPERRKDDLWQRDATRAQSLVQQHRPCNEETPCKRLNQLNDTCNNLTFLSEFDGCGWGTPSESLLVDQECLDAIALQNGCTIPEMDLTDFSLVFVCDQQKDYTTAPDKEMSFISAAERFLQEEDQRATDFEKILNSHLEELQRNSERTLNKYISHSRYVVSS